MKLSAYPQCCKANVLHGFGAGHLSEDGDAFKGQRATKEEITKYLDESIGGLSRGLIQVIFACPTNHQPEAIEALTEYGFFGAPEEELQKVVRLHTVAAHDPITGLRSTFKTEQKEHQMIPMFFLIPTPDKVEAFIHEGKAQRAAK